MLSIEIEALIHDLDHDHDENPTIDVLEIVPDKKKQTIMNESQLLNFQYELLCVEYGNLLSIETGFSRIRRPRTVQLPSLLVGSFSG